MAGEAGFELQAYFDDLLLADAAPRVAESRAASSAARPQVQVRAAPDHARPEPAPVAFADASLEQLEQEKRDKLQALLNSKPLLQVRSAEAVIEADAQPADASPDEGAPGQCVADAAAPAPVEPAAALEPVEEEGRSELVSQYLQWHENGRPHWAQSRFDALLFDVAGLRLAVPLIALGQIQPLTEDLSPLFGQAEWFMGLLPTTAGKIRTINTALFVMPERYDPEFVNTARYVISIDGVPWGLAVDAINQPISVDPDDVKWRSERSKRPWLAGTVKSAMCALIDIPQMGEMLMQADKNRGK